MTHNIVRMLMIRMLMIRMLMIRMLMAWLHFGRRGGGRAGGMKVTATEASRTIFYFLQNVQALSLQLKTATLHPRINSGSHE